MKNLKCWKKVTSFIWVNKNEDEALIMSQKGFEEKFTFSKSTKNKDTGNFLVKEHIFPHTSKSKAMGLAYKYMKENDTC